ncbi:hypothetical protein QQF64_000431, partial [Cirrhinus molitorella]
MSKQKEREEDTASKINSDHPTMSQPSAFSDAEKTSEPNVSISRKKRHRSESSEPSGVSVKSNKSIKQPPALTDGPVTSDPSITRRKRQKSESSEPSCVSVKSNKSINSHPEFSDSVVTSDSL